MWYIWTAIVVLIGLALFYRLRSTRRRSRSESSEVYVCPNCGHQHCDCYKRPQE